jgi:hypothetical protein
MNTEKPSNEEQSEPSLLGDVSGSLPMWTEIHIQPLNVDDIENSKVYWIKHPQKKWSVYDKDLVTAMKEFIERWGNDR